MSPLSSGGPSALVSTLEACQRAESALSRGAAPARSRVADAEPGADVHLTANFALQTFGDGGRAVLAKPRVGGPARTLALNGPLLRLDACDRHDTVMMSVQTFDNTAEREEEVWTHRLMSVATGEVFRTSVRCSYSTLDCWSPNGRYYYLHYLDRHELLTREGLTVDAPPADFEFRSWLGENRVLFSRKADAGQARLVTAHIEGTRCTWDEGVPDACEIAHSRDHGAHAYIGDHGVQVLMCHATAQPIWYGPFLPQLATAVQRGLVGAWDRTEDAQRLGLMTHAGQAWIITPSTGTVQALAPLQLKAGEEVAEMAWMSGMPAWVVRLNAHWRSDHQRIIVARPDNDGLTPIFSTRQRQHFRSISGSEMSGPPIRVSDDGTRLTVPHARQGYEVFDWSRSAR